MRQVARRFGVGLFTVQRWVQRARGQRLDRVDWSDRPHRAQPPANRVTREVEDMVMELRRELKEQSALGDYGAQAIHRELRTRGVRNLPSVRTIGRVLQRHGAVDGRQRTRRPAPPRGWYLPRLTDAEVELDSFDIVEGLVIRGGPEVEVLNVVSLHGGLVGSWPRIASFKAQDAVDALVEHWREFGLPMYAQFDNDTRFQGAHQFEDTFGRVTRLCLNLGVIPVFAPPRETGFQAAIESYNGRWEAKVWSRFEHASLEDLQRRSTQYVLAGRERSAVRIESAPGRRRFPRRWKLNLHARLKGQMVYLRRTTDNGRASLLGHSFEVAANWPHRLVRCQVDLDAHRIEFHALRRRDPHRQPLLKTIAYRPQDKPFQG